ncbi:MAG: hypothetical protein HYR55_14100 [Acidobacteria bacterium]|nr:hypothetical protein [Acidobacteriota bacterium]MBI3654851.1 hypothetical protein [Acidobacteriota bacterium]
MAEAERVLFKFIPIPLLWLDQSLRVRLVSAEYRAFSASVKKKVIGVHIKEVLQINGLPEALSDMIRSARTYRRLKLEGCFSKTHQKAMNITAGVHRREGKIAVILALEESAKGDVNQRVHQIIHERASALSHEINTPLSIISSYAQYLLSQMPTKNSQRNDVQIILSETRNITKMVVNIPLFLTKEYKEREESHAEKGSESPCPRGG